MGAIFQIKRFFDLKKLLFILPLIFCFSLSSGGYYIRPSARVCDDLDNHCSCFNLNSEVVPCAFNNCVVRDCAHIGAGECYGTPSQACVSVGSSPHGYWTRPNYTFSCTLPDGSSMEGVVERNVKVCEEGDSDDDGSGGGDNSPNDPPQADQKKVCSGGECKCYNLTTGKEEPCIGGNNSGGGSNSSGDNGSGSGNTGTGTGSGSGDSGNGQGSGSESSPSAGNGTNSGAGGDNSGTGTGSNNGDNSGGGTHTGSSGNTHGGGGTSLGGGSTGGNNGSPNGSEDGKEDGSDNGHSMGDGLNDYDFGKLPTDNDLPDSKDIDDKKKEIDLGGFSVRGYLNTTAQCPAPTTVDLKLFGTMEIEYTYFCNIARILRAVVVAFAWLSALLIIARINRS